MNSEHKRTTASTMAANTDHTVCRDRSVMSQKGPLTSDLSVEAGDFVAHFRARAAHFGETRALTYLREIDRELVEERVTYADLDTDARAIAAWLAERPEATAPVLLLYVDGIDFLRAFMGCLYAGVIAVPAPLPTDERGMQRLAAVFEDSGVGLVLTTAAVRDLLVAWLKDAGLEDQMPCVTTDEGRLADPATWRMPAIYGDTVAFLQYTSGSTSEPKGVVVTHANLLHNEAAIASALGFDDTATCAGWLPHFHDMGLIGMLLQSLYVGADLVFMSPMTFLKRPVRWLEMIDRYRAVVTVAPNFAYELVARRVSDADIERLDLSSLRAALNGAEPIRAHTLAAVIDRLGEAGFRGDAFVTCYGMAEVTLLATASIVEDAPRYLDVDPVALERGEAVPSTEDGANRLVGCGAPRDLDLWIVDPQTHTVLPARTVGEIWLRGGSVAQGYWRREEETAERFGARTDTGEGPFLRTGDLGLLSDGDLFVTGRLKDLLIVNGRNIYPQDIEEVVRHVHPSLTESPGVVLAVEAGREHIVVIQGVKESELHGATPAELVPLIKRAVARAFEVPAPSVVLVEKRGIHRTTSGKVQRRSMNAAFLNHTIDAVLHEDVEPAVQCLRLGADLAHPSDEVVGFASVIDARQPAHVKQFLIERVAFYLERPIDDVDPTVPLAECGVDSVSAMSMCGDVEDQFEINVDPTMVFDYPTIVDIAAYVGAEIGARG
jgi:acyl-CoA synthetase (AMP-forming)/AMP-acid ligase II/acyl carrier protein